MNKSSILIILTAFVLNICAWHMSLDYLWSVFLVFGGVMFLLFINAAKEFTKDNWKLFSGFFIFSNILTLIIEIIMLKFDVWGFSNRGHDLSGITFLTYPIEEFIYWALCPGIVAFSYILLGKKIEKFINPIKFSRIIQRISSLNFNTNDNNINYTPDDGSGKYSSGKKFPIYIWLQIILISTIIMLSKYYRGNKKAMMWTTLIFFSVAFPNELYALSQGFWLYNDNTLLGLYIFKVPVEGFLMYFLAPVCGCMMLDISNRLLFKKDL